MQQKKIQRDKQAALAGQQRLEAQQAKEKAKQEEKKRLAIQQKKEQEHNLAVQKAREEKEKQKAAEQAAAKKAGQEKQRKINDLLATAEQQLSKAQLSRAYKTYKEVLKLDPRNQRAKTGIPQVAERYLNLANTAANKNDFTKAKSYVNSAIRIDPTNSKLADTQQKIFELEHEYEQQIRLAKDKLVAEEAARKQQILQTPAQPVEKEPEPEQKIRRSFGGF
ncbi:MAG: hypothetical protein QNL62_23650 [Gammaproteobacteria bacterium]|nr:hypothetical protein [Gammaproteobacteria bacterium]